MAIVFAILLLAVGVAALILYGDTPHGGPTTDCGPINFFGNTFTLHADCRYASAAEIIVALTFFLLAVFAALSARPHR